MNLEMTSTLKQKITYMIVKIVTKRRLKVLIKKVLRTELAMAKEAIDNNKAISPIQKRDQKRAVSKETFSKIYNVSTMISRG